MKLINTLCSECHTVCVLVYIENEALIFEWLLSLKPVIT